MASPRYRRNRLLLGPDDIAQLTDAEIQVRLDETDREVARLDASLRGSHRDHRSDSGSDAGVRRCDIILRTVLQDL